MFIKKPLKKGSLKLNTAVEGELFEQKITRILNNREPIKDGAPLMYTEKKDGVLPGTDIRHDKWETATEAMDKMHNPEPYQDMARLKKTAEAAEAEKEENGGAEPTQTTK